MTAAVVILGFIVASSLQAVDNFATAVVIVAVDALLPIVVRAASSLERHHNSVGHEFSVMNKVCIWRGLVCGSLLESFALFTVCFVVELFLGVLY